MKLDNLLSVLASPAAVTAQSFTNWTPPGPGDVRSPCPALNTLANHGFLPHSGKGISVANCISALHDGLNVGADFATAVGSGALLAVPHNLLATTFDLDQLDEHNFPIEHDASLSRADYYLNNGDNHSFNQSIFDTVLAYYNGVNETSIPLAAHAKYNRVQTEAARDPKFYYTPLQYILSYGETALYISVLGDPTTGIAPVEYVKIFFEQERLPYNEGWRPTKQSTNLASLAGLILQLNAATGENLPEGLTITASTVKSAFSGLDPLTGILAHIL